MISNRSLKADQVKEIIQQLNKTKSMMIFEYHGLSVKDLKDLRSQLKPEGIVVKVYKNRLFKLALDGTNFKNLSSQLTGPNIFVFGESDNSVLIKKVFDFIKNHKEIELKVKGGIYEGEVIDASSAKDVSTLPSQIEALSQLIMTLLTPLRNVSLIMNSIKEQQQN